MSDERTTGEVIKNFTRARKVPQMIGRTPDGKKLPFGPYTVPQAVSGAIVGGLLWLLHTLWLRDSISWNVGFFAFWSLGTVFVVGKLRFAAGARPQWHRESAPQPSRRPVPRSRSTVAG